MKVLRLADDTTGNVQLPLNLGLNDGTYMPASCVEVLEKRAHALGLRDYATADNDRLREVIADVDEVTPEHVFVRNGSGPILKQVIPYLIKRGILASPIRVLRHVVNKSGFPVITPRFTYSKVPKKCAELGLTVHLLELGPETGWRLDLVALTRHLERQDGLVYIANPNNPTGNVLATREQLAPIMRRFPRSWFLIDEAYVHYVDPKHGRFASLVPQHDNLLVTRTFSFAYGLAGARIGYMLANPTLVAELSGQLTGYRLGTLQEELAMAAMRDEAHLPWLRERCAAERAFLIQGMAKHSCIEAWDTEVNFVFARLTDGRTGAWLKERMAQRGVRIKCFEPMAGATYEPYFRITLGTREENTFFLAQLERVLAG